MAKIEPASNIRFTCGSCGAAFAVAPELAGRRAVCKRCKAPVVVPRLPVESAPVHPAAGPAASPAARPGPRRRRLRRLAWVFILVVGVGAAGAVLHYGGPLKSRSAKPLLERVVEMNAATIAKLVPDAAEGWEPAAELTARLIAEIAEAAPGGAPAPRSAMLDFLRAQEEFLRAKVKADRLDAGARASVEQYRRHLWHPPAELQQWPFYIEQAEALRQALREQLASRKNAAAAAAERHAALLAAEKTAAARLAAGGLGMAAHFGEGSERMQQVLAEIGGRAPGVDIE
jgi:hypothetical protein